MQIKSANDVILRLDLSKHAAGQKSVASNSTCYLNVTRKLSYRKDDRAMRPMYGCHENFRESLSPEYAHGYFFPKFLTGLCSHPSYECAYKI